MNDIFVRAFTGNEKKKHTKDPENHNTNIRLIFDTETTIDQYQNLTFGSCAIQIKTSTGIKEKWYLFSESGSSHDLSHNLCLSVNVLWHS